MCIRDRASAVSRARRVKVRARRLPLTHLRRGAGAVTTKLVTCGLVPAGLYGAAVWGAPPHTLRQLREIMLLTRAGRSRLAPRVP
eukprot:9226158-Prorocentrum_lima.AAC.1